MATATTDFILGSLPFETRKQRVTQWRLYLLAAYLLCHLIGLTGHLQTLYKVWSESTAGTAGRTLASSNSYSYTPTSTQSPAASAARSRLLNQTPGPNIFGMTELKTTQENEALKRELEKKAPNTGLDAMLGFGLKHGASGVVGGVERFYGTGQKLGGGDSPGLGGSGLLNRNTGSNGSSANSLGQRKELRGSYEKIDD
ncbi:hypothetical protein BCR33DRAFT_767095 [Rhizoclosmatium globosum]|uniref:Uncharacterized protein n=1 Tax=Rhizoclosmatium globosum TaxID=329046 RepID=A0A1Y2C561_9FUNG|nr:hypothetical protein BCR33DRAFT_767095 [Rhizoclosmatium globosum]|eukprot:ORY42180.1 hypothetical protein BCR33DRAFT_767095 [Rhizoclosmatium globosum]